MKTQKLVRKYRILKPNEKIQLTDWWNTAGNNVEDLIAYANAKFGGNKPIMGISPQSYGWCSMLDGDGEHYMEEQLAGNKPGFIFARFVDCVPVTKQNTQS